MTTLRILDQLVRHLQRSPLIWALPLQALLMFWSRPQPGRVIALTGLDDGPTGPTSIDNAPEESTSIDKLPEELTSIDNAPEEWRARFADLLLASTCCWPELEPTDLELTSNVELGDAHRLAA
jgi:hypothetical protein